MGIPFPGPGIVYDMPAATYHAIEAVSSTALKTFAVSPKHEIIRRTTTREPTPTLLLGTAVHTATLEPDKLEGQFLIAGQCEGIKGDGGKCVNSGKTLCGGRWYCGIHAKKFTPDPLPQVLGEDDELMQGIISEENFAKAKMMARSIRSHREARTILESPTARFEVSMFWYETVTIEIEGKREAFQIPCKSRLDIYDPTFAMWGPMITDIKSCQCSFLPEFERDISERRYDLQTAWYLRGATMQNGEEHQWFTFLPIESTVTMLPAVFRCHAEMLSYAHDQIFAPGGLLESLVYCEKMNFWPGYAEHHRMLVCNLPKWHHTNEERERKRDNRL